MLSKVTDLSCSKVYHFDNLFEDGECNSGVNTDKAMNLYISKGASKYKLVMGGSQTMIYAPCYQHIFKEYHCMDVYLRIQTESANHSQG